MFSFYIAEQNRKAEKLRLDQEKAEKAQIEREKRERDDEAKQDKEAVMKVQKLYKIKSVGRRKITEQKHAESSFLEKYDKIKHWSFAMLRDEINNSTDIELLDACRIEFDARLTQHHKWQERLALSQSITGFTSYESYRENTLNTVKQRYFKIIHDFEQGNDKRLKGKTLFYFHFAGEHCQHQVKATYLESDSSKPVLERFSVKTQPDKVCQIVLKDTGLVGTYNSEISASEFAGMWSFNAGGGKMLQKKEFVVSEF